jgi:hypothetical protein
MADIYNAIGDLVTTDTRIDNPNINSYTPPATPPTIPPTNTGGAYGTVTNVYQDLLGRTPDQGGLQAWSSYLTDKGGTEEGLREQVKASDEYRKRQASIQEKKEQAQLDSIVTNKDKFNKMSEENMVRYQQAMQSYQDSIKDMGTFDPKYGLDDLRNQATNWMTQAANASNQLNNMTTNIANNPNLTMNQITGQQGYAREMLGNQIANYGNMANVAQQNYSMALQQAQADRNNKLLQAQTLLDTYAKQYDLTAQEYDKYATQLKDYYDQQYNRQLAEADAQQKEFDNQIKLQELALKQAETEYAINKPYYKASGGGDGTTTNGVDSTTDALARMYMSGESLGNIGATQKAAVFNRVAELQRDPAYISQLVNQAIAAGDDIGTIRSDLLSAGFDPSAVAQVVDPMTQTQQAEDTGGGVNWSQAISERMLGKKTIADDFPTLTNAISSVGSKIKDLFTKKSNSGW